VGLCNLDQFVSFGERWSQWFFDQHINAGFHQHARNYQVMNRGDGNRGGLDFAAGNELLETAKGGYSIFARHSIGTLDIEIRNCR